MKKVLILINKITENPTADELDVLQQVKAVEEALTVLGHESMREFVDLNLSTTKNTILSWNPDVVFNLVEGIDGKGQLIFIAPALLESMNMPFTGSGLNSMFITSDKTLTKEKLRVHGLPTPEWSINNENLKLSLDKFYIVKPCWEDGSVGIDDHSIFKGNDPGLADYLKEHAAQKVFIEEFIKGREFNISILGGPDGPEVLPPAEIKFINFPEGKPQIVGYRSKWDEESFEYHNTPRTFEFPVEDQPLIAKMKEICYKCWQVFNLKGYVRVDFRVDESNNPQVLEINANPCISPDAGFNAACSQAGYTFPEVIERIIYDAFL